MRLNRYQWLKDDIKRIQWEGISVIKENVSHDDITRAEELCGSLPDDYRSYLLECGESLLFRDLSSGGYSLSILLPKAKLTAKGQKVLQIGGYANGGRVFLMPGEMKCSPKLGPVA